MADGPATRRCQALHARQVVLCEGREAAAEGGGSPRSQSRWPKMQRTAMEDRYGGAVSRQCTSCQLGRPSRRGIVDPRYQAAVNHGSSRPKACGGHAPASPAPRTADRVEHGERDVCARACVVGPSRRAERTKSIDVAESAAQPGLALERLTTSSGGVIRPDIGFEKNLDSPLRSH